MLKVAHRTSTLKLSEMACSKAFRTCMKLELPLLAFVRYRYMRLFLKTNRNPCCAIQASAARALYRTPA